jgi:hypothetical protein
MRSPEEPLELPRDLRTAIRSARYATVSNRAATEQAKQLVDHVFERVIKANVSKRPRGPYGKTKQQIRRGVEGFLGDLLRTAAHEQAKGFVHRSLQANSFTREDVGYRAFTKVIERLKSLGFIEHFQGYQGRGLGFDPGDAKLVYRASASRFRATPELLELAAYFGVPISEAKAHFIADLPKHPLQVRPSSRRNEYGQKLRGRRMPIKRTPLTDALEADVRELNEFFDGFELRGGTHRGFIRSFNKGDDPHFRWDMGGRLYSQGDDNLQLMKPEDRLRMTINGEAVCEIDIKASYLTIYLAWFNQPLDWSRDPDPYDLPGVTRGIAKDWFVATFGYDRHLKRWPKEATKTHKKRTGRQLGKDFPLKVVRQKAIQKFPVLKNWGRHKRTWAELMFQESEAVVSTMLRLKREHQIPSLSVHDSLIVPISKCEVAEKLLSDEYFKATKTRPKLEIEMASSNGTQ